MHLTDTSRVAYQKDAIMGAIVSEGDTANNEPKKRTRRMPMTLHPHAVDEALAISLGAGLLPEKRPKKDSRHRATTTPKSKPMKGKK